MEELTIIAPSLNRSNTGCLKEATTSPTDQGTSSEASADRITFNQRRPILRVDMDSVDLRDRLEEHKVPFAYEVRP